MPYAAAIEVLKLFASFFDEPEEHSLADVLRSVAVGFATGTSTLQFGADVGDAFADPGDGGWRIGALEIDSTIRLTGLTRLVEGGDRPIVVDELEIERVAISDPSIAAGQTVELPLVVDHRIAFAATRNVSMSDRQRHPFHRLAMTAERSLLMVYGYVVHTDGTVQVLDPGAAAVPTFLDLVAAGSLANQSPGSLVVLVAVEVVLTTPRADFEPFEVASIARCLPLVSCWTDRPVDRIDTEVTLERPHTSPHAMSHGDQGYHVSFYTDRNSTTRLTKSNLFPPTWTSLFDHYRLESQGTAEIEAVGTKPERTLPNIRTVRNIDLAPTTATHVVSGTIEPTTTDVTKVARQGQFDNVHIAPAMDFQGHEAFMAPVCQHDCLHMHWRWSSGFHERHVRGWAPTWPALGGPHDVAGAPMIPPNQTLRVAPTASGQRPGVRYRGTATSVNFGGAAPSKRWNVFFHHGFGYVTDIPWYADAAFWLVGDAAVYHALRYGEQMPGVYYTHIDETSFSQYETM